MGAVSGCHFWDTTLCVSFWDTTLCLSFMRHHTCGCQFWDTPLVGVILRHRNFGCHFWDTGKLVCRRYMGLYNYISEQFRNRGRLLRHRKVEGFLRTGCGGDFEARGEGGGGSRPVFFYFNQLLEALWFNLLPNVTLSQSLGPAGHQF